MASSSLSRVLMTADAVGGVWTYALDLARELGQHGVNVLLAVTGGRISDAKRQEATSLRTVRLEESDARLEWMDEPWDDVARAGDWLFGLHRDFRSEVVHVNGYAHAALPWNTPVVVAAHSCVFSWFAAVRHEAPPVQWNRYREVVTRGLRAADLVVAPTEAMLQALQAHYGTLSRTRVISNGRPMCAAPPQQKENLILSAGRLWDDAKNIQVLAAATGAGNVTWPIWVAGERSHPDGGTAAFAGLHVLGNLDHATLQSWYERAAIYAHPARYEPFGLTVLEAARARCALVLSDIPSLREVWGDAARYVDADNGDEWRRELNLLAEDSALREELSARAEHRASRFTSHEMARQYSDAYRQAQRHYSCASLSSTTPYAPTGTTATPISSAVW